MRIAVIGGGPGGLYFSYLWKKRHPDARIDLFEQNPAGATWGFGVVFSEQALEFLRADDPDTVDAIAPRMESWKNITLNLRGESVEIDGVGFSSIGRLDLLRILQARAASVGVALHFDTQASLDQLSGYDLIVAADGLNSMVRRTFEGDFGTSLSYSANKFAWYGTTKRFETLSQTFVATDLRQLQCPSLSLRFRHEHFPGRMRFADLAGLRFRRQDGRGIAGRSASRCSPQTLDGHGLISNKSVWRNFPWVWNERWFFKNMVLIGDALHSAHFSIGSGTRLAIEDAIALTKALEAERNLGDALARYQSERQPIVKKLVTAARTSADWYATFPEHMKLDLLDFAYSYITRSGRIDDARLRAMAPSFMARYEASRSGSAGGGRS